MQDFHTVTVLLEYFTIALLEYLDTVINLKLEKDCKTKHHYTRRTVVVGLHQIINQIMISYLQYNPALLYIS